LIAHGRAAGTAITGLVLTTITNVFLAATFGSATFVQPGIGRAHLAGTPVYLSADEIAELFDAVGGMVGVLRKATPEEKSEVYRNLGLRLTYLPETKTVRADVDLAAHRWASGCVRGGT
jgi:hypothetical protein